MQTWKPAAKSVNAEYRQRMKDRGEFLNGDHELYYMALELCGEAGELANKIKKMWSGEKVTREALCEEIADVRIYLQHIADFLMIDVDKACLEVVKTRLEKK